MENSREVLQGKQNILLFDYQNLPQQYISTNLQKFTKMRDLFNELSPLVPTLILANLVASLVNATLFSCATFSKLSTNFTQKFPRFPIMTPQFQMINLNQLRPSSEKQYDKQEPDQFVQSRSISYNFGYCDIRKSSDYADISLLKIFRTSADLTVWFCLLLAITLVSVLISKASASFDTRFSQFQSTAILATLSVLLTPGTSNLSSVYRLQTFNFYFLDVHVRHYGDILFLLLDKHFDKPCTGNQNANLITVGGWKVQLALFQKWPNAKFNRIDSKNSQTLRIITPDTYFENQS